MYQERKIRLAVQIEGVEGLLKFYQKKVVGQELSLQKAQSEFYKHLSEMRYSGNGYYFAFTTDMVLKATLKGKAVEQSVANVKDANGLYVYQNIYKATKSADSRGYSEYNFQRTANGVAEPILSYALHFKPWNLIVGTGIYISDIDEKAIDSMLEMALIVALILLGFVFIGWKIISAVIYPIENIQNVMAKVESGDMTQRIDSHQQDELGQLSHSINSMLSEFHLLLTKLSDSSTELTSASDSLSVIAQQTNGAVNKQTEEIQTVVSAIEEMSLTVKEVESNTLNATTTTQEASTMINDASVMVAETMELVDNVSQKIDHASLAVDELKEGSSEIAEV